MSSWSRWSYSPTNALRKWSISTTRLINCREAVCSPGLYCRRQKLDICCPGISKGISTNKEWGTAPLFIVLLPPKLFGISELLLYMTRRPACPIANDAPPRWGWRGRWQTLSKPCHTLATSTYYVRDFAPSFFIPTYLLCSGLSNQNPSIFNENAHTYVRKVTIR